MGTVIATLALVLAAGPCWSIAPTIGPGRPIGEHGFEQHLRNNPELQTFVALRGYPDWVEEFEVDNTRPLEPYELHLYYLRLDREVAFTRAYILGRPRVSLRLYDRPLAASDRARIEAAYLAVDPARRAEYAADRAMVAAERAERAAVAVERMADSAEQFSARMEEDFHRRLRK
jgi:hypothetical protein